MPPRSVPAKPLSDPSSRPMGVRAPATMTDGGLPAMALPPGESVQPPYDPPPDRCGIACLTSPYGSGRLAHGRTLAGMADLVTAIDHVGIAVPDLDIAVAW